MQPFQSFTAQYVKNDALGFFSVYQIQPVLPSHSRAASKNMSGAWILPEKCSVENGWNVILGWTTPLTHLPPCVSADYCQHLNISNYSIKAQPVSSGPRRTMWMIAVGKGRRYEWSAGRNVQFTAVQDFHLSPGTTADSWRDREREGKGAEDICFCCTLFCLMDWIPTGNKAALEREHKECVSFSGSSLLLWYCGAGGSNICFLSNPWQKAGRMSPPFSISLPILPEIIHQRDFILGLKPKQHLP